MAKMVGLVGIPNLHLAYICANDWMDGVTKCNCFNNKFSFVLDLCCGRLYDKCYRVSKNSSTNKHIFVWR